MWLTGTLVLVVLVPPSELRAVMPHLLRQLSTLLRGVARLKVDEGGREMIEEVRGEERRHISSLSGEEELEEPRGNQARNVSMEEEASAHQWTGCVVRTSEQGPWLCVNMMLIIACYM